MNELPAFIASRPLPPPPQGWNEHGYAALSDGKLVLSRVDVNAAPQDVQWSDWPKATLRLSCYDGDVERDVVQVPGSRWPLVDRLEDGSWVVVASRAEAGEKNLTIYAPDGSVARRFAVGDGVEHLACSSDGRIWIGYFDEGIFGGPSADGTWPPASSGLAAFDLEGACTWQFDAKNYAIADCDAMTISGSTLWACTYLDYPIFRVEGSSIRRWHNAVMGARAMAASETHIILSHGYSDDAGRNILLRLDDTRAVIIAEMNLPGAAPQSFVAGRNGTMHAVVGGRWLSFTIGDWCSSLPV